MSKPKLISFNLCPFVQRSAITLELKGVDYDIEYVDLADKPEWFLKISPFGKVPLLLVDDVVIFESAVINEYLDETTGTRLHPEDALLRARNRAMIEYVSSMIGAQYMATLASTRDDAYERHAKLHDGLERVEEAVVGPYFNGDEFSLVDAAAAPLLQRMTWVDAIEPDLANFRDFPKLAAWRDTLLALPAVKASTVADIEAIFGEYVKGRGSPTRKVEPAWLGQRAG